MTMAHKAGKKSGKSPHPAKKPFGTQTHYAEFSSSHIPISGAASKGAKKHGHGK